MRRSQSRLRPRSKSTFRSGVGSRSLRRGRERTLGGSRRLHAILLLVLVCVLRADLAAQAIDGVLLERGTDRPIALGLVTLFTVDGDTVASALTNGDGRFTVESPRGGDFLLGASALGYQPTVASSVFTLTDDGGLSLQFRIEPLAVQLQGLTVEAEASLFQRPKLVQNGFVERAQSGFGRFLTPQDIEASHAPSTADLLAETGRVTTRRGLGGDQILMLGSRGFCSPIVYLDGIRVAVDGVSLDALAPVFALEAAEVYRSASEAPLRYGGGMAGCGVIVLWTKSR